MAVRSVAKGNDRLAIDLLKGVDIGIRHRLADDVFMNFAAESSGLLGALTAEDVDVFLNRLMTLPELEGYWIETFLAAVSATHAARLAKFVLIALTMLLRLKKLGLPAVQLRAIWTRATAIQKVAGLRSRAPAGI